MHKLKLVSELAGHTDRAWAAEWSPDGSQLASCSGDKTVRIWSRAADETDSSNGTKWLPTAILEDAHTRTIRSCSWSPNGRYLATASFDATTAIWEHQGGVWEQVATLEGHENEVKGVAWSPDGSFIATCGRDKSVWIWESIPGNEYECVDVKQGHGQDVKCVVWHPSGEVLASASYDDTIRLWVNDGDEWVCAQTLGGATGSSGHSSTVWSISFEPSGDRMVTCSDDLTLRIWSCSGSGEEEGSGGQHKPPWRLLCTLSGHHQRTIYSCHWGPGGMIAAGDGDNAIKVYTQDSSDDIGASGSSVGAALSQHWTQVAVAEDAHSQDVNCVRWHPTDPTLLASAGDDGIIKLWRCNAPQSMQLG